MERVTEIKDLGVIMDSKLTFKNHINKISSNEKKALGFIMENSKIFTKTKTLRMLYFALVRSQLEFASRRCHKKNSYVSNYAFITLLHEWVDIGQMHQLEKLVFV